MRIKSFVCFGKGRGMKFKVFFLFLANKCKGFYGDEKKKLHLAFLDEIL